MRPLPPPQAGVTMARRGPPNQGAATTLALTQLTERLSAAEMAYAMPTSAGAAVFLASRAWLARQVSCVGALTWLASNFRTLPPLPSNTVACPNACSERGSCISLTTAGRLYGPDGGPPDMDGAGPAYGVDSPSSGVWDASVMRVCDCDWGFAGADCSEGGHSLEHFLSNA